MKSLNDKYHETQKRARWINALILVFMIVAIIGVLVFCKLTYTPPVPVTCEDKLRVSELNRKALKAEIRQFLMPDRYYVINTMSSTIDFKLRGIINGL